MTRCARCGSRDKVCGTFPEEYNELGGTLKISGGRSACSKCRKEISAFVAKKVSLSTHPEIIFLPLHLLYIVVIYIILHSLSILDGRFMIFGSYGSFSILHSLYVGVMCFLHYFSRKNRW